MTVDANRCNIAKNALSKLTSLQWGSSPPINTTLAIYENYLLNLNCPTSTYSPCYTSPCISGPNTNNCGITINSLTSVYSNGVYTITANLTNANNPPLHYTWQFDTNKFTIIGDPQSPSITLRLNSTVNPLTVSTPIYLTISDVDGCSSSIECGLVKGQFLCGLICPSLTGLSIDLKQACYGVNGVTVN